MEFKISSCTFSLQYLEYPLTRMPLCYLEQNLAHTPLWYLEYSPLQVSL
jgi:hypothetical protein